MIAWLNCNQKNNLSTYLDKNNLRITNQGGRS